MEKILITGGQASGKSTLAIKLADAIDEKRVFIATAKPIDGELEEKIRAHQRQRGDRYHTIEEPIRLDLALKEALNRNPGVIVIDCMTLWISNLLFEVNENKIETVFNLFLEAIKSLDANNTVQALILVTNECGWGIIPADALSRKYVKYLGNFNKKLAAECDKVYMTCCGLQMRLK